MAGAKGIDRERTEEVKNNVGERCTVPESESYDPQGELSRICSMLVASV